MAEIQVNVYTARKTYEYPSSVYFVDGDSCLYVFDYSSRKVLASFDWREWNGVSGMQVASAGISATDNMRGGAVVAR